MIKNIELTNYKCFDELSIRLSEMTVIAGQNSAGKSSVIQALLLLRQSYNGKLEDFNSQFIFNGNLADLKDAFAVHCIKGTGDNIRIAVSDSHVEDDDFWADISGTEEKAVVKGTVSNNYKTALKQSSLFSSDFIYLYANRLSPQVTYMKGVDHFTHSRIGDRTGHLAGFRLQQALDDNEEVGIDALCFSPDLKKVSDNVSMWLGHVMGESLTVTTEGQKDENEVAIVYKQNGIPVSPVNMAFGYTYVLPIIFVLMTATPDSLIIIENPEAHLHPSAQLRLGELLAKAAQQGVQIIVETHSDHLLNGIRVAAKKKEIESSKVSIHYFWKDKDGHYDNEIELLQDGTLGAWPEGFFDEWEKALQSIM